MKVALLEAISRMGWDWDLYLKYLRAYNQTSISSGVTNLARIG